MKRVFAVILVITLCMSCSFSLADRKTVVKDEYYLGAMRIVKCKEYVSLRERPDKTSRVLAEVPLDAIVLYCSNNIKEYLPGSYKKQVPRFIRCDYEGVEGYILKQYLAPAPEFEPAETKQNSDVMTREEIIGNGEIVLEWNEFNVSVLAAYEVVSENNENWEYLRIGCFIDDEANWGYTEAVKQTGETRNLKAFMGGTEDEPQVYVYDAEYGLVMLDLMDGMELWTLTKVNCPLGDAAAIAVDEDTGMLYTAGTDGPDPVAIDPEGEIFWRSEIDDPEVYGPKEITLTGDGIEIVYESGKTVTLSYDGELIDVSDTV